MVGTDILETGRILVLKKVLLLLWRRCLKSVRVCLRGGRVWRPGRFINKIIIDIFKFEETQRGFVYHKRANFGVLD